MKKFVLLFMGGLAAFACRAQWDGDHHREPFIVKTFPRDAIKELQAETSGGNIAVFGAGTGDAKVEVYVQSNNNNGWNDGITKEEIQKRLDEQYDLEVGMEGGKLVATAHQKHNLNNNWRRGLSISFRVYVPEAVNSRVRTSGGNIELKALTGSEDFHTSGGNLDVAQLSGTIVGRTSGGNVTIKDSHDDIDLQTSGGNMEAERCEGKIRLETSGGNVGLRHVKGTIKVGTSGGQVEGGQITGELQAHTSGGNIDFEDVAASLTASTSGGNVGLRHVKGTIRVGTSGGQVEGGQITGELQAHTSGGNIDFEDVAASLTASTSGGNIHVNFLSTKAVDLENSSGDITLQLPQGQGMDLRISGERVHSTTMNNFSGKVDEHHIDGSLNGGGIPIHVDGNGGEVHLSFK
jgi:DUF4097 and DUF4098 domain-containing protein YvlB